MIEFLGLFKAYYLIFAGFIGYILWHKIYNTEEPKIKLRDDIDSLLRWINLSSLVFLGFWVIAFLFFSIIQIFNNTIINISDYFETILEIIEYSLIFFIIFLSAILINKNKIKEEEFILELRSILLFIFTIYASSYILIFFYNSISNVFINFVLAGFVILYLFLLLFESFKVKKIQLETKRLIIKYLIVIFISCSISFISSFFLFNDFNDESFKFDKVICEEYKNCNYKYVVNYSLEHGFLNNYYYLDFFNDEKFDDYEFLFLDSFGEEVIYSFKNYRKDNNYDSLDVHKFDFNGGIFAFDLNDSLRKNVSNILIELYKKDKNSKNHIFNLLFEKNSSDVNVNLENKNNFELELNSFNTYVGFENCTFEKNDFEILNCRETVCKYNFEQNYIRFHLRDSVLRISNAEIKANQEINFTLPIICK